MTSPPFPARGSAPRAPYLTPGGRLGRRVPERLEPYHLLTV